MSAPETRILPADAAGIAEAVRLIGEGQPVALPTETVYGLAADATSGEAVARIYAAKGRPSFNPLIVHVPDFAAAERIARFNKVAEAMAWRFWPGPLTMVLSRRDDAQIAGLVTAGLPTIAVRVPAHPVMQAVLNATGLPLAAPSANASGRVSPTRAEHVLQSLGGRIPLILDAGPTEVGLESTIVDATDEWIRRLRPGPISSEALGVAQGEMSTAITAPGQLANHYSPAKPIRLDATAAESDEWLIGFGRIGGDDNLSPSGNLIEAAARLFDALHIADVSPRARIAVAPIPARVHARGFAEAINDRLRRAASPR